MDKFVDQCNSLEHADVINRQPLETLDDGCNMTIYDL